MCGCEFGDPAGRTAIDGALLKPAQTIARMSGGESISDEAWDIFFGRSGGALSWRDLSLIKQSYDRAAATAAIRAAFRRRHVPRSRNCEPLAMAQHAGEGD